ncbi:MAG: nucleotidyl transferase AbiEii/AbiGii toxin family protein [Bacteroidales bacterium]|nr:nucleotidyl transferase AbiEii/AbiGii toxin family protein [Bacteroidales bacterium]
MADFQHLKHWLSLPDDTKRNIFTETGREIGLSAMAAEKDWWAVHTLLLVFSMDCASELVFKGGTSLSKAWNVIERFSEDIDLALNREYLGFKGELSKGDIKRLRRTSFTYITETFVPELKQRFADVGFKDFDVKYREVENYDQDPVIIEIYYPKLTEEDEYLKPGLLLEIGSRSLKEPYTERKFKSFVAEVFKGKEFADPEIAIPSVNPERTFLEKIFLLHEEFQRPEEKIRVEKLSRHLYDIEKLMDTEYAEVALTNQELYQTIVEHRSKFSKVSGVDYARQQPEHIKFIPPDKFLTLWESDYIEMQESMIYGESLPFDELIEKLKTLQERINSIRW